jgi:hypothetical protein
MKQKHPGLGYFAALGSAALVGVFTVLNKCLLKEGIPKRQFQRWRLVLGEVGGVFVHALVR